MIDETEAFQNMVRINCDFSLVISSGALLSSICQNQDFKND
jgi:hypothetical protein